MWFPILFTLARAAGPDSWLDAVVFVQQGSTSCAGARIDEEGTVVTAYHCVAPGGHPRVSTRDGSSAVGRVRGVDRARDLARIEVPGLAGGPWLAVHPEPPSPGSPVWVMGHPLGADPPLGFYDGTLRFSVAEGVVSAVGVDAIQTTAPLNPGHSGGPLVDDRGRLVGVVSRRLAGQGLGFCGRVDGLDTLPDRSLSPVGGTVAVELSLLVMDSGVGVVAPRLEVADRDRVVLTAWAGVPLSARWSAARFGDSSFLRGEGQLALRQRFGRGTFATRADLFAGLGATETRRAEPDDPFRQTLSHVATLSVGGILRVRNVGFELGWSPVEGAGRASLILRAPGVVQVW